MASTTERVGFAVDRRPATYPASEQCERPAAGDVVGGRHQVEQQPAAEAERPSPPRSRAAGPRATTTSSTTSGTIPWNARCGNTETCRTRAVSIAQSAAAARGVLIRMAPVGLDDGAVAVGAGRHDDADEVEGAEVDVRVDDRALGGVADAGVDRADDADRHSGDVRRAVLAAPGDDRVALRGHRRSGRRARGRAVRPRRSRRGRRGRAGSRSSCCCRRGRRRSSRRR